MYSPHHPHSCGCEIECVCTVQHDYRIRVFNVFIILWNRDNERLNVNKRMNELFNYVPTAAVIWVILHWIFLSSVSLSLAFFERVACANNFISGATEAYCSFDTIDQLFINSTRFHSHPLFLSFAHFLSLSLPLSPLPHSPSQKCEKNSTCPFCSQSHAVKSIASNLKFINSGLCVWDWVDFQLWHFTL